MKLPKSIVLGCHEYEIRSDRDTARLLRDEDSRGDSRPDHLIIRIDADRPHTAVAETLFHESLHCAWNHTALNLGLEEGEEETVVTAISPLIVEMLRRNPDLVAYLLAEAA